MSKEQLVLEHATIGSLKGNKCLPEVHEFIGIQYATLKDRFARGVIADDYPAKATIDATSLGPLPVANTAGCDMEHLLLQQPLPHPEFQFSDTECLNLNIWTPSPKVRSKVQGSLPVVAFVHGGGFTTGSASFPHWELAKLVETSVGIGKPVVAVGLNYRLGVFGFLTSPAMRRAGYLPNNGLHDQKLALRWIQAHIAGFGGDPFKVTYLGSSIGAYSAFVHLQSEEALFHQVVALGGSGLIRPVPLAVADGIYEVVVKALALDDVSSAEKVEVLLKMHAQTLQDILDAFQVPTHSTVDGDVIKQSVTFMDLADPESATRAYPGLGWCKSVFMVAGELDGMVFAVTALKDRTGDLSQAFQARISQFLGKDTAVPSIASTYSNESHSSPSSVDPARASLLPVLRAITDVVWTQPARASAEAWIRAGPDHGALLAHFAVPNPWPGLYQGHATHALDLAFLLQNYNAALPSGQREVARRMAKDVLSFAHGDGGPPFKSYRESAAMLYAAGVEEDGRDESRVMEAGDDNGRWGGVLRPMEWQTPETLDRMMDGILAFVMGV